MNEELLSCPFCKEPDFDLIGLKLHLQSGCEAYDNTPAISNPMIESREITATTTPPAEGADYSCCEHESSIEGHGPNCCIHGDGINDPLQTWCDHCSGDLEQPVPETKGRTTTHVICEKCYRRLAGPRWFDPDFDPTRGSPDTQPTPPDFTEHPLKLVGQAERSGDLFLLFDGELGQHVLHQRTGDADLWAAFTECSVGSITAREIYEAARPHLDRAANSPTTTDFTEQAQQLVKHISDAALELAFVRHSLTSDEVIVDDDADVKARVQAEEEFCERVKEDTLNCLTGDDTGCLDPEELDESNCELLWTQSLLNRVAAEAATQGQVTGRQAFASELLGHLDRITSTTAAYHLVRNLCLIELGREPDSTGAAT